MELLSDLIGHFLAIISIIISVYCFLVVRRPKFIVITKRDEKIVTHYNTINLMFKDDVLTSNLYYQKLVICYLGVSDTKDEDKKIPVTIYSNDSNTNFHDVEILRKSPTFEPTINVKENAIEIESSLIKNGDAVELNFLALSSNPKFLIKHRYHNVDSKTKYFVDDNKRLSHFFIWSILLIVIFFTLYSIKENIDIRHAGKADYLIEYNFQGYKVREKYQWKSDSKVDSLFVDAYKRRYNFKDSPTISIKDKLTPKEAIIEVNNIFKEMDHKTKVLDSLKNIYPSKVASATIKNLERQGSFKFGEEVDVNNDLKITVYNPKVDSVWDIIGYTGFVIIFLILSIVPIYGFCTRLVELIYFYRIKKHFKI